MNEPEWHITLKLVVACLVLTALLVFFVILSLSTGSSGHIFEDGVQFLFGESNPMIEAILWRIRLPRVMMAAFSGATLSLGGLVFQALLRNPLAEPYILGVSGGSAIGAFLGIMMGLSPFPGVGMLAFIGSMVTLGVVLAMTYGKHAINKESVLLSGVMINAFCSALIMFLISMTQSNTIHSIMFWLMGDLSSSNMNQAILLGACVVPCFILIFVFAHTMNFMLLGADSALSLGINIPVTSLILLTVTSFMISATVCQCGLLGFVGLVIPHIFRLALGPDHRILVPSCLLGGSAFLVFCDLLSRMIPTQGEMPVGVITAMIGAPVFIALLRKQRKDGPA